MHLCQSANKDGSHLRDVRKTGQFTHVSSIFGHDVRGKRFITHVTMIFPSAAAISPGAFPTVTVAAEHLAILGSGSAAVTPWGNVVSLHLTDIQHVILT